MADAFLYPQLGELYQVAPGVRWIRSPMPFALDHINLWLLEDEARTLVVDTGMDDPATRALWDQLLSTPAAFKPGSRIEFFVTHMHPDHVGMAGTLAGRLRARLFMTQGE